MRLSPCEWRERGALKTSLLIGSNTVAVLCTVNTMLHNELATLLKRLDLSWMQLDLHSSYEENGFSLSGKQS